MFTTISELADNGELLLCRLQPSKDIFVVYKKGYNKFITERIVSSGDSRYDEVDAATLLEGYNERQRSMMNQKQLSLKELRELYNDKATVIGRRTSNIWMSVFLPSVLEISVNVAGKTWTMPPSSEYESYNVFIPRKLIRSENQVVRSTDSNGNELKLSGNSVSIPPNFIFQLKLGKEIVELTPHEFLAQTHNAANLVAKNARKRIVYNNERLYEKNTPKILRDRAQWVGERLTWTETLKDNVVKKKFAKMIVNPHNGFNARVDDPSTWGTFEQACEAVDKFRLDGIGFVLQEGQGIFCLDLDYDRQSDGISEVGKKILESLKEKTYTELSAGGNYHIFGLAKYPGYEVQAYKDKSVELFQRSHAIMITGRNVGGISDLEDVQSDAEMLYEKYFKRPEIDLNAMRSQIVQSDAKTTLSANEIISKLQNGNQSAKFDRLMRGDLSDYGGQESAYNAADLALCSLIAYYTDDPRVIDSIYRKSNLYSAQKQYTENGHPISRSQKWDKQRKGGTYGEQTIQMALRTRVNKYEGIEPIALKDHFRVYKETEKAYLVKSKGAEIWLPKSRCKITSSSDIKFVVAVSAYYIKKYNLI